MHYGQSQQVCEARVAVLRWLDPARPEHCARQPPMPPRLLTAAWIDPLEPNNKPPETGQWIRPDGVSQSLTRSMRLHEEEAAR